MMVATPMPLPMHSDHARRALRFEFVDHGAEGSSVPVVIEGGPWRWRHQADVELLIRC